MTATIRKGAKTSHLDAPGLREHLPQALRGAIVDIVDRPVSTPHANWSNVRVRGFGTPYRWCQSGFAVGIRHLPGLWSPTGVLTAGHCSDAPAVTHILQPSNGVLYHFTLAERHTGTYGDVARHTVSYTLTDDFYASNTTVRDVSSVRPFAAMSVNEKVCLYSRQRSLTDCTSRLVAYWVSPNIGVQWRTDKDIGIGGDSGAAIFYGNVAYGIHFGGMCPNPNDPSECYDSFSLADYTDEALGNDSRVMY